MLLEGVHWSQTGGYYYLHRNVPLYLAAETEAMRRENGAGPRAYVSHIVCPASMHEINGYTSVARFGAVEVRKQLAHEAPYLVLASHTDDVPQPASTACTCRGSGCPSGSAAASSGARPAASRRHHGDAGALPACGRASTCCEAHLVRHHHHGHAVTGQAPHDAQHLVDQLGVQRGRHLVEQNAGHPLTRPFGRC